MGNPNDKLVYCTWSGGIDSTGVIGQLLKNGWQVKPVTIVFGEESYRNREAIARGRLMEYFEAEYPELIQPLDYRSGDFLQKFAVGGLLGADIPRRNKHILDFMMAKYVIANDGYYLGMGEYIGADTWLVKDHVGMHDCDARYFAAYMLNEYGLNYRYITLADFGESRYKADRVRLLVDAIGPEMALTTSNCMFGTQEQHCGKCYKCVERHVAFEEVLGVGFDTTNYMHEPKRHPSYTAYLRQMAGELVDMSWEDVNV